MKYCINHTHRFESPGLAFSACLMQTVNALNVELICLSVISFQQGPLNIVYNFIALAIISNFDDFIFESFIDILKELIESKKPLLPILHTTSNNCLDFEKSEVRREDGTLYPLAVRFRDRSCGNKFNALVYRLFRSYYISIYFYFMPYFAILISIFLPQIFFIGEYYPPITSTV